MRPKRAWAWWRTRCSWCLSAVTYGQTARAREPSREKTMPGRGVCVMAAVRVCCAPVCATCVCVARLHRTFLAVCSTGKICVAAWWYTVPQRVLRYPPRYGFSHSSLKSTLTTSTLTPCSGPWSISTRMAARSRFPLAQACRSLRCSTRISHGGSSAWSSASCAVVDVIESGVRPGLALGRSTV
eukprot:scaffold837_cov416-Prasinococcus_capsulatus_cf.AAC.2